MDGVVAASARDQGPACAFCHDLYPGRFDVSSWLVEVGELTDVMNLQSFGSSQTSQWPARSR